MATAPALTIEQLTSLRNKTEAASKLLDGQLKSYLETIKPLLAPRRVLGRHVASREDVNISDRMLDQLKAQYGQAVGHAPYGMTLEFPEQTLTRLDNLPMVYPIEYLHAATHAGNQKALTITSPVRWMLTYENGASPALVRQMLEGKVERRTETIKQFVVNALTMGLMIQTYPGLAKLLDALRYHVQSEVLRGFGNLTTITVHACLDSFRPPDDLLMTATALSGVPAFVELIQAESLRNYVDPLTEQLRNLLT
jgi:hypothetical protein